VALRRLRSAMTLFKRTVDDAEHGRLKDDIQWLTRRFGEARNLDVLIERYRKRSPPGELVARRDKAYDDVAEALRAPRRRSLFLRLVMWIEGGAWRSHERAARPVTALAERQLTRQWARVTKKSGDLGALDADALHKLRIAVKKLRYSAEFLSGLYADRSAAADRNRFVTALKTLQECLGELNDEVLGAELTASLEEKVPAPRRRSSRSRLKAAGLALERAAAVAGFWTPC
jgi:CHAD domain-containing protein